ncbi:creatininase family protein [Oscillochloris sp. ZM17-4]|uniref:creatininase family protein n=1 Tax=Oscillochloris sp. ZM17-4 TaxID=2866714 RepID=UPI001C735E37|nr:creatininase family protein [Oscillochloris sp. ZM17-4]MBX0330614.1 creatininase family protein [Oscillochloris sp. ZM17-4]
MQLLFDELNRAELRALAPGALVVLPVGATEQHGPHLPVGTDRMIVEHIARAAAAEAAATIPVLVAPTLPFGSSHHHVPFGGTLSLGTETYYRALIDLAETLIASGFRQIFILNGHGGNNELIQLVARDLALKHDASLAAAPYWTIAWDALVAEGAHIAAGLPGHAGTFETSLVLALRPDLVREPRPHRDGQADSDPRGGSPYRAERHGSWQQIEGYTDSPDQADAPRGQRYLAAIIREVARALREFHQPAPPDA